jgi:hypothetical protein
MMHHFGGTGWNVWMDRDLAIIYIDLLEKLI